MKLCMYSDLLTLLCVGGKVTNDVTLCASVFFILSIEHEPVGISKSLNSIRQDSCAVVFQKSQRIFIEYLRVFDCGVPTHLFATAAHNRYASLSLASVVLARQFGGLCRLIWPLRSTGLSFLSFEV